MEKIMLLCTLLGSLCVLAEFAVFRAQEAKTDETSDDKALQASRD
jgi:hypothetical protein